MRVGNTARCTTLHVAQHCQWCLLCKCSLEFLRGNQVQCRFKTQKIQNIIQHSNSSFILQKIRKPKFKVTFLGLTSMFER